MEDQILLEAFVEFIESIYFAGYYEYMSEHNTQHLEYEYIVFIKMYGQMKNDTNYPKIQDSLAMARK